MLRGEPFLCERMILAHQAYDLVFQNGRDVQMLGWLRPVADRNVELALSGCTILTRECEVLVTAALRIVRMT